MNEDEPTKPPSAGEQGREKPAKSVVPSLEEKSKAESEAKPETMNKTDRPRRKRGIMRSFFSHIIVAALAVAGVGGYFHWEDLLSQAGGRVCAYEVLGRYGSSLPGEKPMALPASQEKAGETVQPKQAPASKQSSEMKLDEKSVADKEVATALPAKKADKPALTAKEDTPVAAEAPAKAAAPVVKEQAKVATSVVSPKAAKAEAPKEEVAKPVETAKTSEPVAASLKTAEPVNIAGPAKEVETPKVAELQKTAEPVTKVETPKTVTQPVASDTPLVKIVKSTEKKTFETEWADARRAYWAGDTGAEQAYLDLIAQYPDQADIKGELGNIYIKAGSSEKAASQFFDAGLIWVKSGEKDKVAKIINLLEKISPEKSTRLKDALAKTGQ